MEKVKELKKVSINSVNISKNIAIELTTDLIKEIQEIGLSYQDISAELDIYKINRSMLCLIKQKRWFPPDSERRTELIEKLIILKKELKKEIGK